MAEMAAITLAEELPFAAAVKNEYLSYTCSHCFHMSIVNKSQMKMCQKCHIFRYCSSECQKKDFIFHKYECDFMARYGICPQLDIRLISRVITRVKRGDLPVAFNGRTFDDLVDHAEDYKKTKNEVGDKNRYNERERVYQELLNFMGANNLPPKETALSYIGKVENNKFPSESGQSLIIGLSGNNHSCRPDCFIIFNGNKMMLQSFNQKLTYSKDLTFSYFSEFFPRPMRCVEISFYQCSCERCLDEDLNLIESSGKSSCCPKDGVVLPIEGDGPLVCTNCGQESALTYKKISWANDYILDKCLNQKSPGELSNGKTDEFLKMHKLFDGILSPYNLYLVAFTAYIIEHGRKVNMEPFRRLNKYVEPIIREICMVRSPNYYIQLWDNQVSLEMATLLMDISAQGSRDDVMTSFKTWYFLVYKIYGKDNPMLNTIQEACCQYFSIQTKKRGTDVLSSLSKTIDLLTRGVSYPLIFAKASVGSKVMEDGQLEVTLIPLKTEGIYEKLVVDVKRQKITRNTQAKITGKPRQTDLDSICLKQSAKQIAEIKKPAQQSRKMPNKLDFFHVPTKGTPAPFSVDEKTGRLNPGCVDFDDEESMRKHGIYRTAPGLLSSYLEKDSESNGPICIGENDELFKILSHVIAEGGKLNVSKDQMGDLNQEETREELITAKIVDQTSHLKDTDEKLDHEKEELDREADEVAGIPDGEEGVFPDPENFATPDGFMNALMQFGCGKIGKIPDWKELKQRSMELVHDWILDHLLLIFIVFAAICGYFF